MRVLVTGGAGFIGSHLVAALLSEGAEVRVLDDLSTGSRRNLEGLTAELIVGDISDPDVVNDAVKGCDLIFHQAALVSVPHSIEKPRRTYDTIVTGTFNLFEAARLSGVSRVVYASSSAVYGDLPGLPKGEHDPLVPMTPYAAAKRVTEVLASAYERSYGLELIGLRYMNVFGPRQDPSSPYSGVISIFCQAALSGRTCTIYGDGEQTRDFVYVDDVVKANLLAAKLPAEQLPTAPIFNVGRGEQTSLNQIVEILVELTGQPLKVAYTEERPGDIKHSVADVRLAQRHLGFQANTSVPDGLQATLRWFRSISEAR